MGRCTGLIIGMAIALAACSPDGELEQQLEDRIADYPDATVAVAVRDAETRTSVDLLSDRPFHAASTMKVPVMIEAWRRVRADSLSMDDSIRVKNEFRSIVDSSLFSIEDDSDDAIYERLGESMTISELIYQMITVSSNLATNLLIDHLDAAAIQRTVDALGARGMHVLRGVEDLKAFDLGLSNATNARALARLMEAIQTGTAVDSIADRAMVDVLLDQQFNEMIPAGLPAGVHAAHKTGQITRIHHDAAIVYAPDAEPYVLVILIEGLDDHEQSAALGAEIARTVHRTLR